MASELPLTVVHMLSREEPHIIGEIEPKQNVHYHPGRISIGEFHEYFHGDEGFYMCGPPGLQENAIRDLNLAYGVPDSRISRELFFW
jgi:ferredoxin-NADP reductase